MQYRREVDGLRALAVIPVIFFHAGFESFQGGFVGVDVFFVISGYLITSIILKEREAGRFSLLRFYERRIRRILPALYVVSLCCVPFAIRWMTPAELGGFSQSLTAVALFVSNILFWRQSGYFDTAAEEKPLLHTWSLAVEEQYYLFFPLFILMFWFLGRARLARLTGLVALFSLALAEWGWRFEPTANFFLLPTRAWELFTGALCAFYLFGRGARPHQTLSFLGIGAILFAVFNYSDLTPFPSIYALAPVLGTALIILYGTPGTIVGRLLASPLPVGIGLISYSAYLWHQPLFAFARIRSPDIPSDVLMLALAAVSLGLAVLSWRFVEVPFRRSRIPARTPGSPLFIPRGPVFATAFAGAIVLIGAGMTGSRTTAFERLTLALLTEEERERHALALAAEESHPMKVPGDCRYQGSSVDKAFQRQIDRCYRSHGPAVVVIGDSHADDIYHALALSSEVPFIVGLGMGGCRPMDAMPACPYDDLLSYLEANGEKIGKIIFNMSGSFLVARRDGSPGDMDMFRRADMPVFTRHEANVEIVLDYLDALAAHAEVLWLGPRMEPQMDIWNIVRSGCDGSRLSLKPNLVETFLRLDRYLPGKVAERPRLRYLSTIDAVDFDVTRDFWDCERIYFRDGDHWSEAGERRFGKRLVRALEKGGYYGSHIASEDCTAQGGSILATCTLRRQADVSADHSQ